MTTKPNDTAGLEDILGKLAAKNKGTLTAETVLKAAEKPTSPLHHHFNWDDSAAARNYRLIQAAQLIRRVRISYVTPENKTVNVRGYVNVTPEAVDHDAESPRGHYVAFDTAMKVPSYREQLLANARRDAETFGQKYSSLEEIMPVIEAMKSL